MHKFLPVAALLFHIIPGNLLWAAEPAPEQKEKKELEFFLTSFEPAELGSGRDGKSLPKGWTLENGEAYLDPASAFRGEMGFFLAADDPKKGPTQLQFSCEVGGEPPEEAKGKCPTLTMSAMMRVSPARTAEGHEFLDFDGCLLALVGEKGAQEAELQLFHNVDGENGWWFSTGHTFPLGKNGLTGWLEVTVTRNYQKHTYSVEVDGQEIMGGIAAYLPRSEERAHVWFFGGAESSHQMDDFLFGARLTTKERMELRERQTPKLAKSDPDAPPSILEREKGVKTFKMPSSYLERRRKQQVGEDAARRRPNSTITGASIQVLSEEEELNQTEMVFKDWKGRMDTKKLPANKGPITIRITLNTEIEEGLRLDHMTWTIKRLIGRERKELLFATGDFGDGLIQEVGMPYDIFASDDITVSISRH